MGSRNEPMACATSSSVTSKSAAVRSVTGSPFLSRTTRSTTTAVTVDESPPVVRRGDWLLREQRGDREGQGDGEGGWVSAHGVVTEMPRCRMPKCEPTRVVLI